MLFKRTLGLFALALGSLGVVACVAGIYGVWQLGNRLEQANDKVFTTLDKGLATTQDRVRDVQKRVKDSRITSSEISRGLRDWGARKAEERIVARLEIDTQAETLSRHLETADTILENSTESVRGMQSLLELGSMLGSQIDPASLDEVIDKLTSLRGSVQQAERTVDGVREFTSKKDGQEESRWGRATKLIARTVVTIVDVDTRLDQAVARLAEARTNADQMKTRTSRYILLTTLACCLVLAWIAAGQVALCRSGWRCCWGGRSTKESADSNVT